jgi:hypothetical protein
MRVFVESVLRYGLPPEFVSAVIKVPTPTIPPLSVFSFRPC